MHGRKTMATVACVLALAARALASDAAPAGDWRVVAADSRLRVLVFRAGLLGRLGHNHVVAHGALQGCARIAGNFAESRAQLSLAVADFVVDDAADRQAAGESFPVPVPADDIEATRANMLGPRLLDADEHPRIELAGVIARGSWPQPDLRVTVAIAGGQRLLEFPVSLTLADERLRASGTVNVTHEQLGLEPFTAALGTLRVSDSLVLRFELAFERSASGCERALAVVEDDGIALADDRAE